MVTIQSPLPDLVEMCKNLWISDVNPPITKALIPKSGEENPKKKREEFY